MTKQFNNTLTLIRTVGPLALLFLLFLPSNASNKWEMVFSEESFPEWTVSNFSPDGMAVNDTVMAGIIAYATYWKKDGVQKPDATLILTTRNGFDWDETISYEIRRAGDPPNNLWISDTNTFHIAQHSSTIRSTFDRGETFHISDTAATFESAFENMYMLDSLRGYTYDKYLMYTEDAWKTWDNLSLTKLPEGSNYIDARTLTTVGDTTIYIIGGGYDSYVGWEFIKLDPETNDMEVISYADISNDFRLFTGIDVESINEDTHISVGRTITYTGGPKLDCISRSSDGGKTWNLVLDFYADSNEGDTLKQYSNFQNSYGIQDIEFRDSLVGIAVGQFTKIVYTYDGGRTWIYESNYHKNLIPPNSVPAVMHVEYFKGMPLITTFSGEVFYMVEDNLAPKPEDTLNISGRVTIESGEGLPVVPVALGNRICMTDSSGYYNFTRVASGYHRFRVLNKYYDGPPRSWWYYKPYLFEPMFIGLDLASDTVLNFSAIPNEDTSSVNMAMVNTEPHISTFIDNGTLNWSIEYVGSLSDISLTLYDLKGRVWHSDKVGNLPLGQHNMIDISSYPKGIYYLAIQSSSTSPLVTSFVVQM